MKVFKVFDEHLKKIQLDDIIDGTFIEAKYITNKEKSFIGKGGYYEKGRKFYSKIKTFLVREKITNKTYLIDGLENVVKYIKEFELKMYYKTKH